MFIIYKNGGVEGVWVVLMGSSWRWVLKRWLMVKGSELELGLVVFWVLGEKENLIKLRYGY